MSLPGQCTIARKGGVPLCMFTMQTVYKAREEVAKGDQLGRKQGPRQAVADLLLKDNQAWHSHTEDWGEGLGPGIEPCWEVTCSAGGETNPAAMNAHTLNFNG